MNSSHKSHIRINKCMNQLTAIIEKNSSPINANFVVLSVVCANQPFNNKIKNIRRKGRRRKENM